MNLFQTGEFTLSSGIQSNFKIDCDALTDDDIETLATIARTFIPETMFGDVPMRLVRGVYGVPSGGNRLVFALRELVLPTQAHNAPILIVDDVFTTGRSMETVRLKHSEPVCGVVIFARAPCPRWIKPLFQVWEQP